MNAYETLKARYQREPLSDLEILILTFGGETEAAELAELHARIEELEKAIAPIAKHRNWLDHEVLNIIEVYERTT